MCGGGACATYSLGYLHLFKNNNNDNNKEIKKCFVCFFVCFGGGIFISLKVIDVS